LHRKRISQKALFKSFTKGEFIAIMCTMLGVEQFMNFSGAGLILTLMIFWSIAWKGIALWKAAKVGSKVWFIIILLVNTFGILEIIYIFAVKPKMKLEMKDKRVN
jgi:hypothetical protein